MFQIGSCEYKTYRIVSKIGDSYGSAPHRIQYAGSETGGLSVDYNEKNEVFDFVFFVILHLKK